MRAVPRAGAGLAGPLALVMAVTMVTAACTGSHGEEARADESGGPLTVRQLRACLAERPGHYDGLVFRTTTRPSDSFVGVVMMDLTTRPARTGSVGIAVYDDAELLRAYEERARRDPSDEVARVRNAVVSYHTRSSPRLELGARWVDECLQAP